MICWSLGLRYIRLRKSPFEVALQPSMPEPVIRSGALNVRLTAATELGAITSCVSSPLPDSITARSLLELDWWVHDLTLMPVKELNEAQHLYEKEVNKSRAGFSSKQN
jgi:hypothetical protein